MKTKILTLILGGLMSTQVWAYGVGQSTHPMAINDRLLAQNLQEFYQTAREWVFKLGILKS